MRGLSVIIIVAILSQPRAHAQPWDSQANPNEAWGYLLLTAAATGLVYVTVWSVASLIRNGEEFSESRNTKYALLEGGIAHSYGTSYAGGAFLSKDSLPFLRYTQHLSPNRDIDFKTYEIGYRHYYKVFFGEVGFFDARHRQVETESLYTDGTYNRELPPYSFDSYETRGAFASFGLAVQVWRISLAVRGTFHRGFSNHTTKTYENSSDTLERLKEDARNEYNRRRTVYLDLGLAI